jgi:hypothetical protein
MPIVDEMRLPTTPSDPRLKQDEPMKSSTRGKRMVKAEEYSSSPSHQTTAPSTEAFDNSSDMFKTHIQTVEKECSALFAEYMTLYNQDPTSDVTKTALETFNARYDHLKKLQNMLEVKKDEPTTTEAIENATQDAMDVALENHGIKGLLFLQLYGDNPPTEKRRNFEAYRTTRDFCTAFEAMLVDNRLTFSEDWERTLPLCLNKEDSTWFKKHVKGKDYQWKDARMLLIDHKETPFIRMFMMMEICHLRQEHESVRSYAYKYEKLCKDAHVSDGTMLATQFLTSLRPPIRECIFSALEIEKDKDLPRSLTQMVDYVVKNDTTGGSGSSSKRARPETTERRTLKKAAKAAKKEGNPCRWCGEPFNPTHRCQQYYDHKNGLFIKR